jgi:hypothetical protein
MLTRIRDADPFWTLDPGSRMENGDPGFCLNVSYPQHCKLQTTKYSTMIYNHKLFRAVSCPVGNDGDLAPGARGQRA